LPPPPPPKNPPIRLGSNDATNPPAPPPPPPEDGLGFLVGADPPPPEFNTAPRTGNKAAAVVPASLLPVAALRIDGAAFKSKEAKSGPPPPGGAGLCGLGVVLFGAGLGVVLLGAGVLSLDDDPDFDSQQTVPLLQELVLCKILEGLVHREDID